MARGQPADLIFFDPFSPASNPALWTPAAFAGLRAQARSDGDGCTLFTYSAATPTRVSLLLGGFYVGTGVATGMKKETTVAATQRELLAAAARRALARTLGTLGGPGTARPGVDRRDQGSGARARAILNELSPTNSECHRSSPRNPLRLANRPARPRNPLRLANRPARPTNPLRLANRPARPTNPLRLADRPTRPTNPSRLADRPTDPTNPLRLADRPTNPKNPTNPGCSAENRSLPWRPCDRRHAGQWRLSGQSGPGSDSNPCHRSPCSHRRLSDSPPAHPSSPPHPARLYLGYSPHMTPPPRQRPLATWLLAKPGFALLPPCPLNALVPSSSSMTRPPHAAT